MSEKIIRQVYSSNFCDIDIVNKDDQVIVYRLQAWGRGINYHPEKRMLIEESALTPLQKEQVINALKLNQMQPQ